MIVFSSPINVGTISFVPGSTEKVEFYIATGNTGYYNHNQPAPSFHPYYEVNHGSSIVINYSISLITIKMKEATGEPFSLREIMVFEELHLGLGTVYPRTVTPANLDLWQVISRVQKSVSTPVVIPYTGADYPEMSIQYQSSYNIQCVFLINYSTTSASVQINTNTGPCYPASGYSNTIDNLLLNKWECPASSIHQIDITALTYQDLAFDMIVILSADYCGDRAIEIIANGTEDIEQDIRFGSLTSKGLPYFIRPRCFQVLYSFSQF